MSDWTNNIMRKVKQQVVDKAGQLVENRIQHLRPRIQEEGATVEIINDPTNEQVRVRFDNISDELKAEVLKAVHNNQ